MAWERTANTWTLLDQLFGSLKCPIGSSHNDIEFITIAHNCFASKPTVKNPGYIRIYSSLDLESVEVALKVRFIRCNVLPSNAEGYGLEEIFDEVFHPLKIDDLAIFSRSIYTRLWSLDEFTIVPVESGLTRKPSKLMTGISLITSELGIFRITSAVGSKSWILEVSPTGACIYDEEEAADILSTLGYQQPSFHPKILSDPENVLCKTFSNSLENRKSTVQYHRNAGFSLKF